MPAPLRRLLPLALLVLLGAGGPAAAAAGGGPGEWSVDGEAPGTYRIGWTAAGPLPTGSARPEIRLDGRDLGPTVTSADGRTVTVAVHADAPPDPARLDLVLSGRTLDEPARPPEGEPLGAPLRAPATVELGVDPGRPGGYDVVSESYSLPDLDLGLRRRVEMEGYVVRPADGQLAADAPLVLFLHGRHSFCYSPKKRNRYTERWPCPRGMRPVPSDRGYAYVQRLLASQGFVTVSIAANGVNAQDGMRIDGGAAARSRLVRRHLDRWAGWAASGRYPVDLSRVVLVGHSRGGEGVNRAAEEIPLDAPYRIAGQVLLAPTNFSRQTAAYVPTVTVLPYCDGDLTDLQGQTYTDVALGLADDDTSLRSTVIVNGANHNYFNTEWTPGLSKAGAFDDAIGDPRGPCGRQGPGRLSAGQQRAVGQAYVAGAVRLMATEERDTLPMLDGSAVRVASAGAADVRTHALGLGRRMIRPGREASLDPGSTAKARLCRGYADGPADVCGPPGVEEQTPHWPPVSPRGIPSPRALEMSWSGEGRAASLDLGQPIDLTGAAGLDLRVVVDPTRGAARIGIRLTDADGGRADLALPAAGVAPSLPTGRYAGIAKYLAQAVRIPRAALEEAPIDLARIRSIGIVGGAKPGCAAGCREPRSRIWLLDLAVSPPGPVPAVPARRLPLIDLAPARAIEGQRGRGRVKVPFELSGPLTAPARFVVTAEGMIGRPAPGPVTVDLAPGQTSGTFEVGFRANRVDDLPVRALTVTAHAVRGAMPRRSPVSASVIDDDPTPALRVRPRRRKVASGHELAWKVTLAKPVGYHVVVSARFVAGRSGPRLRVGDLPAAWRQRHGRPDLPLGAPLAGQPIVLTGHIRPGRRSALIRVPTKAIRSGPARRATLRLRSFRPRLRAESTVTVLPRR